MIRFLVSVSIFLFSTQVYFAQFEGNQSPDYPNLVKFYDSISKKHSSVELYNMGKSDYGLPIYLCILNGTGDSTTTFRKARNTRCGANFFFQKNLE